MIHLICPNPAIDRTLLFDSINFSIPNRPLEVREFPGGKSFNVAYSYSFDSNPNDLMIHTMLGGLYGQRIKDLAHEKGYQVQTTEIDTNSRLCNILVDQSKLDIIPVYEQGFELNPAILDTFTQRLIDSIQNGDTLVFSGSLMKGMPANYIRQIKKLLDYRGISINLCVDTSGPALLEAYQSQPTLIKINDEEILDIFPKAKLTSLADYHELLRNKIDSSIPMFVITLGSKGAIGRINGEIYYGKSNPVQARNPIASGDFFLGRMVKGLTSTSPTEEILKDALLFATANVLSWYPEVTEENLNKIRTLISSERL